MVEDCCLSSVTKVLEGSSHGLIRLLYRHFPGGARETHEQTSGRIIDVLAEIRTMHLLNARPTRSVITVFWDITTCSPVIRYQYFGRLLPPPSG
jgi:hypothetical protein